MELRNVEFYMSNTRHWHMNGNIYGDIRNRWNDGHAVRTSRVIKIERKDTDLLVYTRNSEYLIKDYKDTLSDEDLKVIEEWL